MANVKPRGRPQPDHNRITRAGAPKWRSQSIPSLGTPVENANLLLNKSVATLAKAGSHPGNPILKGLGVRVQFGIPRGNRITGFAIYQKHGKEGGNLVQDISQAGFFGTFDFMAGSGQTVAGNHVDGAVRNFFRASFAKGGDDCKECWIQDYEPDVVTLNGEAALDDDLEPVEIVASIVDGSRDWLDITVDFMPSWNDEFQGLHRSAGQQAEAGFRKAYGGALFISFFDTTPGTEGVGVECNPVNKAYIHLQRTLQVQNTAGLKHVTARFRSEQDSTFVVDVPLLIRVVEPEAEQCTPPLAEPCTDLYLKRGTALPEGLPSVPSEPDEQVVEGEAGEPLGQDLLFIQVRGQIVGATPRLLVDQFAQVASAPALAGARYTQVGSQESYLPLVADASGAEAPPHGAPKIFTIALSVNQLKEDNVATIVVHLAEDDHLGPGIIINGPKARSIGLMPIGGSGGGPTCAY